MPLFREENIGKILFTSSILLVALLTLTLGSLLIRDKLQHLETDLVRSEEVFIAQQKELLKLDVTQQLKTFKGRREQIKRQQKKSLKDRVSIAKSIALNLYLSNKDIKSRAEIEILIQETLRTIRLDGRFGYFFVISPQGDLLLYPNDPRLEGSARTPRQNLHQQKVIRELVDIALQHGEGYSEYLWNLPGEESSQLVPKLSFVSYFEPYDWVIGTGEYYEDIETSAKKIVLEEFSRGTGGESDNYYFIYQLHNIEGGENFATMLVNSNRPDLVGKSLSDNYRDAKGLEFRKQFLKDIREQGESFVTYWYKKPGNSEPQRKLSYFKHYPDINWVVAKGVYFDELDKSIVREKKKIQQITTKELMGLAFYLFLSICITIVAAFFFTKGITKILDKYKQVQKEQYEDLCRLNKDLEKQAITDALTGVYNKKYFNLQLEMELARSRRNNTPVSLVYFDIDHFKKINDTFGHLRGDSLLQELSALVRSQIRQADLFVRWGGDEFAILAFANNMESSITFAEKIRKKIASFAFSVDSTVTCSFGVVESLPEESEVDFMTRADIALYEAKKAGRNRVVSG
jgi:diguanylate cyclase (GGDEF)-like protein